MVNQQRPSLQGAPVGLQSPRQTCSAVRHVFKSRMMLASHRTAGCPNSVCKPVQRLDTRHRELVCAPLPIRAVGPSPLSHYHQSHPSTRTLLAASSTPLAILGMLSLYPARQACPALRRTQRSGTASREPQRHKTAALPARGGSGMRCGPQKWRLVLHCPSCISTRRA